MRTRQNVSKQTVRREGASRIQGSQALRFVCRCSAGVALLFRLASVSLVQSSSCVYFALLSLICF